MSATILQDQSAKNSLKVLEQRIQSHQLNYAEVGEALTEIKSQRLYKAQYNTFEEYCEKRWGFARQTIYDYIHAAAVNVRMSVQNRPSLSQAVELSRLEPQQQQNVASKLNFADVTVEDVRGKVNAILGAPKPKQPSELKEFTLDEALDRFVRKAGSSTVWILCSEVCHRPGEASDRLSVC